MVSAGVSRRSRAISSIGIIHKGEKHPDSLATNQIQIDMPTPTTQTIRAPALCLYSLSDSSLAIAFSIFLWQNVQVFHPNLANILGAPLRVCTKILLSQLRKMLILHIRSHCKMCPLPTIQSCVFVLFATDKHARSIVLSAMCTFYNRN